MDVKTNSLLVVRSFKIVSVDKNISTAWTDYKKAFDRNTSDTYLSCYPKFGATQHDFLEHTGLTVSFQYHNQI